VASCLFALRSAEAHPNQISVQTEPSSIDMSVAFAIIILSMVTIFVGLIYNHEFFIVYSSGENLLIYGLVNNPHQWSLTNRT
jgi:hypothetical protein